MTIEFSFKQGHWEADRVPDSCPWCEAGQATDEKLCCVRRQLDESPDEGDGVYAQLVFQCPNCKSFYIGCYYGQESYREPLKLSETVPFEYSILDAQRVSEQINSNHVRRHIWRMRHDLIRDPESAIGTAKEFIETICKFILEKNNVPYKNDADMSDLFKEVKPFLRSSLYGKQQSNNTDQLLSHLSGIIGALAATRNVIGRGHGKPPQHQEADARYAHLAIGIAATLGRFVVEEAKSHD